MQISGTTTPHIWRDHFNDDSAQHSALMPLPNMPLPSTRAVLQDGCGTTLGRVAPAKSPMFTRLRTGVRLADHTYMIALDPTDDVRYSAKSRLAGVNPNLARNLNLLAPESEISASPHSFAKIPLPDAFFFRQYPCQSAPSVVNPIFGTKKYKTVQLPLQMNNLRTLRQCKMLEMQCKTSPNRCNSVQQGRLLDSWIEGAGR